MSEHTFVIIQSKNSKLKYENWYNKNLFPLIRILFLRHAFSILTNQRKSNQYLRKIEIVRTIEIYKERERERKRERKKIKGKKNKMESVLPVVVFDGIAKSIDFVYTFIPLAEKTVVLGTYKEGVPFAN